MFESVLVQAPEDHAALEISYETGDAVIEQSAELAKQLKGDVTPDQLKRLLRADARLDVMHFERVSADSFADDDEEFATGALDPGSLLNVVEALAKLTHGLPIDPASGAILTLRRLASLSIARSRAIPTLSPESRILYPPPCSPKKSNPARSSNSTKPRT